ncbi:MAG: hypothetical protein AAGF89_13970, partial [Bacteroidota bacterium]
MKNYRYSPLRWSSIPLALLVLLQSLFAFPLSAQSAGPTQPEFQQTVTVGADNLVDPFTGNFNYSIPLMEIGGFPLTLSYSSDHKMEEEASWVGFGWTLNPGVISRQVRGLPDDFKGEEVIHRGHMAPSVTTGITPGADFEFFGRFGLSAGLNFTFNNYTGFDFRTNLSPSISLVRSEQEDDDNNNRKLTKKEKYEIISEAIKKNRFNASLSMNFNSRTGLESMAFGMQNMRFSANHSVDFGGFTYTPTSDLPRRSIATNTTVKVGGKLFLPDATAVTLSSFRMEQGLAQSAIAQPAYGYLYLDGAERKPNAIMDYNVEKGGIIDQDAPRLPFSYGTPDVFSISGPGQSGQIEIARNDIGVFRPAYVNSSSVSTGGGADISVGNALHSGANLNAISIYSTKGEWRQVESGDLLFGRDFTPNDGLRESAFMRMVGDPAAQVGKDWFEDIGGENPLTFEVKKTNGNLEIDKFATGRAGVSSNMDFLTFPGTGDYRQRRPRARVVNYLTAEEAAAGGLEKSILRYNNYTDVNADFSMLSGSQLPSLTRVNVGAQRQAHHISQIDVTEPDGRRCVYGLPVYNLEKREVTFNAAGLAGTTGDEGTSTYGTISYENALDAPTINNRRGID